MDTKKSNEQVAMDLQIEDTSKNIKKSTGSKKVSAKKVVKTDVDAEGKKKVTKTKVPKAEVSKKSAAKKAAVAKPKATKTSTKEVEVALEKKPTRKVKANKDVTKKKIEEKNVQLKVEDNIHNETLLMEETTVENIEENKTPILEDIKRFKLFFVSDMDDEAVYLHDMSLQGYHFVNKKGMQYIFRQGEPKNYYYHLGYYEKDKKDGDRYVDNYIEAGWENIYHEKAEFDGVWNYFRIEMPIHEAEPNIFSDRVSRLALYKRLLSGWRSLLAVDVICFLALLYIYYSLSTHPSTMTGMFMTGCTLLLIIVILVFIVYLRAYFKISRKQEELLNI